MYWGWCWCISQELSLMLELWDCVYKTLVFCHDCWCSSYRLLMKIMVLRNGEKLMIYRNCWCSLCSFVPLGAQPLYYYKKLVRVQHNGIKRYFWNREWEWNLMKMSRIRSWWTCVYKTLVFFHDCCCAPLQCWVKIAVLRNGEN